MASRTKVAIFRILALCSVWETEIFELLLGGVRTVCAGFADPRRGAEVDYSMADIGLSAFSLFFMQSESFLAYQRRLDQGHGSSNCRTLFGMRKIPTDNYIRLVLDPSLPGGLAALLRPGDRAAPAARRAKSFSAAGQADAGGAGWDGVFLFAKAEALLSKPFGSEQLMGAVAQRDSRQ